MTATATGRAGAVAQSAIIAASFAMLLAGSNAINPLLPAYRNLLGLDALTLSLTFVIYVTVLVIALFVLARPGFTRHAVPLLLASLAVAIPSDLLLAHAEEWSILAGRALAGVAGGLGTGAASALVVAAIGARGRGVTATGNSAGGVIGAAGSQIVFVLLGAAAPQTVFLGHAALLTALLFAATIVLWKRRGINGPALSATHGPLEFTPLDRSAVRLLLIGALGWTGISIGVVFGATVFAELHQPIVQAVGPTLLLGTSAAAQLASPGISRIAPWMSGMVLTALGVTGIVGGAWTDSPIVAIAGFGVLGIGVGVSFRASLIVLTRGATPARQGALASLYAAATYTVAALIVLLIGWIGNITGLIEALFTALGVVGLLALAVTAWAPRLRDTSIASTRP